MFTTPPPFLERFGINYIVSLRVVLTHCTIILYHYTIMTLPKLWALNEHKYNYTSFVSRLIDVLKDIATQGSIEDCLSFWISTIKSLKVSKEINILVLFVNHAIQSGLVCNCYIVGAVWTRW